jgi:peptidoglycan/xylan/chitin deacetylase (PgdA/CDA1 family)
MHVPLGLLEAVVVMIQRLGAIVPLQELVARYVARRSTAGLVSLTSDDAYVSLLAAEPFLRRSGVPLTVFAVSGALTTGQRFWWDRLDDLVGRALPERWRRFEDECGLPAAYRQGQPPTEGPTRPLRQWILAEHSGRMTKSLEESFSRLEEELGGATPQRSMTEPELAGFLARTGAQLGVHTASHAALPFLRDDDLVAEVRQGHGALRSRFGNVLPYLAVPFGLFDARTLRLAAQAGMTVSLTLAGSGLDRPFTPDLGLPRLCVVREHGPGILTLKASGAAAFLSRARGRVPSLYPVLPSATT